jgi:large subunit ribosomal protein L21
MLGGDDKAMVGTPFVQGAAVEATVVSHRAGDKIIVFKFEARKRKRRKTGHRQQLSELRIGAIRAPGERPASNPPPTNASNARIAPERGSRGPAGPPSPARGRKTPTKEKTTEE